MGLIRMQLEKKRKPLIVNSVIKKTKPKAFYLCKKKRPKTTLETEKLRTRN